VIFLHTQTSFSSVKQKIKGKKYRSEMGDRKGKENEERKNNQRKIKERRRRHRERKRWKRGWERKRIGMKVVMGRKICALDKMKER